MHQITLFPETEFKNVLGRAQTQWGGGYALPTPICTYGASILAPTELDTRHPLSKILDPPLASPQLNYWVSLCQPRRKSLLRMDINVITAKAIANGSVTAVFLNHAAKDSGGSTHEQLLHFYNVNLQKTEIFSPGIRL